MKIELKKMLLVNFKGVKSKTINFTPETFVFGDNATGKTTLFDAFIWMLFGKDSAGRSDFEIKTLDAAGNIIPKIDHEVECTLDVDGKEVVFKRVLREKWVKKRGFEETTFEGNETIYFIDDIPLKAGEYQAKTSEIIDENLFKLITSPSTFNAIKWQDRREMLISMVDVIDQDEIITNMEANAEQKQWLLNLLASDKSISDQKKAIAAQINREKDELKTIPTRIDEVERSKPEIPEGGFDKISKTLSEKEGELATVESQIGDKSKALDGVIDQIIAKKKEVYNVQSKLTEIGQKTRAEAKALTTVDTSEYDNLVKDKLKHEGEIKDLRQEYDDRCKEIKQKRADWAATNAKKFEFDEKEFECPVCKRAFENEKVDKKKEEIQINFNEDKRLSLNKINKSGQDLAAKNTEGELKIADTQQKLKMVIEKLKAFSTPEKQETEDEACLRLIDASHEHSERKKDLDRLQKEVVDLEKSTESPDTEGLKVKKTETSASISDLKQQLVAESTIATANTRIKELESQEKTLSQSIAEVERSLFVLDKYNRSSIEALESKINALFDIVRFKMFEQQINGGELETCICTVKGVPFSDLNTAMKINAGLDIINTLSSHYSAIAPIFVDGRESVVKLIDCPSQIINLVVSKEDKELRIA